ncbi:DnaJ domain-containing protein [Halosimplex sp. TS25]|uniref:DnaJ domain-containing protein n=1 Tax=Halosimplex rarum TaxID=3396619 RepID=UPI0039EA38FE
MSTTFYGVLGVGPDAGDDAIRAAYRERVKDHHPDVSAAPDAAEQFKRLTAAKEVLLDPKERGRYDRLGHASYVDAHCDPSLWVVGAGSAGGESAASTAPTQAGPTATSRSRNGRSRSTSRSRNDGSRSTSRPGSDVGSAAQSGTGERSRRGTSNRARTAESDEPDDATASADRSATGTQGKSVTNSADRSATDSVGGTATDSSDAAADPTGARATGPGPSSASAGAASSASSPTGSASSRTGPESRRSDSTATGRSSANSTQSGGTPGSGTRSSRRDDQSRRGGTTAGERRRRSASATAGSYARSSFWNATDNEVSGAARSDPLTERAVGVLQALGAWVLVHLLFLSLAVGTGWYVYAVVLPPAARSLPLLFVLVGEVGLAVVLSSLHILSRVYR